MLAAMDAIEPAMVRIRAATVADAAAIARVDVETWRETYAGVLPQAMLVGLAPEQRRRGWARFIVRAPGDVMVATHRTDGVIGFGSCGVRRGGPVAFAGEVFTLYVEPGYQGEGWGAAFFFISSAGFSAARCRRPSSGCCATTRRASSTSASGASSPRASR